MHSVTLGILNPRPSLLSQTGDRPSPGRNISPHHTTMSGEQVEISSVAFGPANGPRTIYIVSRVVGLIWVYSTVRPDLSARRAPTLPVACRKIKSPKNDISSVGYNMPVVRLICTEPFDSMKPRKGRPEGYANGGRLTGLWGCLAIYPSGVQLPFYLLWPPR